MRIDADQLLAIFDRTSGRCHLCHGRLAFCNYGRHGQRGAWEVEHSWPRAHGGTNYLQNLYAAHIGCNRSKGVRLTRSVRRLNGHVRAPLALWARQRARRRNSLAGALVGIPLGALMLGPAGAWIGAAICAAFAYDQDPDRF
jgi:hypothetical protein